MQPERQQYLPAVRIRAIRPPDEAEGLISDLVFSRRHCEFSRFLYTSTRLIKLSSQNLNMAST
jgi:hypothetical protein